MTGMGVKPETAYQADVKWCIDHIYTNQEEFSQADLESIEMRKFRNPSVYIYVRKLQGFLNGANEAPAWPPTPEEMENATQTKITEAFKPVVAELVVTDTTTTQTEAPEFEEVSEVEVEEAEMTPRAHAITPPNNIGSNETVSFTKVSGFGNSKKEEASVPDQNFEELFQKTVEAYGIVDGNVLEVQTQLSKLEGFTQTKLSEIHSRMTDIEKSLLFIINSAILPEGQEIVSLNQIPSPPY
tara:strand:- start:160 stop:882 length:723 start_codon:yes stop_codon:yes gene_type:complete